VPPHSWNWLAFSDAGACYGLQAIGQCYTFFMKAHVWVMPKRTVLDPQGQTIQHALSGLGYAQIKDVRQGKFFVLNLDGWNREEAQAQIERISKEVLTNTVIEEFRFEIVE
jgi:phosphoribosylformylglycinamidine synthase PurS subunit